MRETIEKKCVGKKEGGRDAWWIEKEAATVALSWSIEGRGKKKRTEEEKEREKGKQGEQERTKEDGQIAIRQRETDSSKLE